MSTEPLPPPPWAPSRPRRAAAKPPITRDAIVSTALALLDADGLEGVSMRRVADQLGTGPASLYQHIANKEELLDLLLDTIVGEVEIPAPDPDDWQTPLKQMLRETRRVLVAHGDIAYVMIGRVPTGPNALAGVNGMLAILAAGGVPGPIAAYAVDALALYVSAVAYEEAIRARSYGSEEAALAHMQEMKDYFTALPADRFPAIVAIVDDLIGGTIGGDERFEFALDVQIAGIAVLAARWPG